jgi:hypothetical protein
MFRSRLESIGQRIWPVAAFALGVTLFTPALFGGTCVTGTLESYESEGANYDCGLGPGVGYGVEVTEFEASGTGALTSDEIKVTPTFIDGTISLTFSAEHCFDFATSPGDTDVYTIDYMLLDPELPKIKSTSADTGPGDPVLGLAVDLCGSGTLDSGGDACVSGGDYENFGISGNNSSNGVTYPATGETSLDTRLILTLDPCESIRNFSASDTLATPEPSSLLWLTPGLLAIGWLRKKRLANGR